jgi:hypothetical protein
LINNILWSGIIIKKMLGAFCSQIIHDTQELREDEKDEIMELTEKDASSLYASLSCLSQSAVSFSGMTTVRP